MTTLNVSDPAREVLNQAPPLQPISLLDCRPGSAARRWCARAASGGSSGCARPARSPAARRLASTAAGPSATSRGCSPMTASGIGSTRSSSIPPGTGCSAGRSRAGSTACRGASERAGAHVVRAGAVPAVVKRQRRRDVPGLHDLRGDPRAARGRSGSRRGLGAAADRHRLRDRCAGRHGDDRAPGRLRRARQHHPGRAGRRRRLRDPRPQVVLLLSAVRRVPGPRPGAGRPVLLPGGARAGDGVPAAQGQARHPLAALLRGRVPRHRGPPDRRGGPRRPGDHPDGQPHPPGLHARLDRRAAPGHAGGDPPRPPPPGLRRPARRSAGDAQRARRSGHRVRGRDRRRPAGRPRL